LLFLTGLNYSRSHSICVFIATAIHYFFLVAAFWMNVMCFDVARAFASSSGVVEAGHKDAAAKRRYKLYSAYAWGVPLCIAALGHVVDNLPETVGLEDYKPTYASTICWINNRYGMAIFFSVPIGTLTLENVIFALITVINVCLPHSDSHVAFAQSGGKLLGGRKFGIGDRVSTGGVKFKFSGQFVARQRRKQGRDSPVFMMYS
jgi:hypothetical protein